MLSNLPENHLRVYLIWIPVLQSDDRASAENRFREFADKRFTHFWDSNLFTGLLWQRVLGMREVPWDVYLLYRAGSQWEKEPARPDFWVRQLGSGVNRRRFELKVQEMLNQTQ